MNSFWTDPLQTIWEDYKIPNCKLTGDLSLGWLDQRVFIVINIMRWQKKDWKWHNANILASFLLVAPSSMPFSSPAIPTWLRPLVSVPAWTPGRLPVQSLWSPGIRRRPPQASRRRCGPGRCSTVWPATSSGSSRAPRWPWPSSLWSWRRSLRTGSLSSPTYWKKLR